MSIRRTEHPNYTPAQIVQHLETARLIADDAELSEADRAVLLPAIFDKLSSKQVVLEEIGALPNMVVPRGLG